MALVHPTCDAPAQEGEVQFNRIPYSKLWEAHSKNGEDDPVAVKVGELLHAARAGRVRELSSMAFLSRQAETMTRDMSLFQCCVTCNG